MSAASRAVELTVAAAQLVRMRREPDLRVVERPVVGSRRATRVPPHAADRVRELALARLDGRDAFRQLGSEPTRAPARRRCGSRAGAPARPRSRRARPSACRRGPRFDDMRGPAELLLRDYAARSRRSSARARRTISSRSPKRRRAFSTRSDCQSSCRRVSRSLSWLCTLVSRPSARCCQSSWRSSEMLLDLGMDLVRCHGD